MIGLLEGQVNCCRNRINLKKKMIIGCLYKMEGYNLENLQLDLRIEFVNGLIGENVELVKDLMFCYKSDFQDWKDMEKWSDIKQVIFLYKGGCILCISVYVQEIGKCNVGCI